MLLEGRAYLISNHNFNSNRENKNLYLKKFSLVGISNSIWHYRWEVNYHCTIKCRFLEIKSSFFLDLLGSIFTPQIKQQIKIMKNSQIFSGFDIGFLLDIIPFLGTKSLKIGDTAYKQGDIDKNIYFIKSGKVEVQIPQMGKIFDKSEKSNQAQVVIHQ